jgi:hypothetical protein
MAGGHPTTSRFHAWARLASRVLLRSAQEGTAMELRTVISLGIALSLPILLAVEQIIIHLRAGRRLLPRLTRGASLEPAPESLHPEAA